MINVTGIGTVKWRALIGKAIALMYQPPLKREREFYRRLRELNDAVNAAPDDITLLALRGELLLERGELERAKADFERALALADELDDTRAWHIVEQVMRDRAAYGLRQVARHEPTAAPIARE